MNKLILLLLCFVSLSVFAKVNDSNLILGKVQKNRTVKLNLDSLHGVKVSSIKSDAAAQTTAELPKSFLAKVKFVINDFYQNNKMAFFGLCVLLLGFIIRLVKFFKTI